MSTVEEAQSEILAAMAEIDKMIANHPAIGYYSTLRKGLQMILDEMSKKWPLDQMEMTQLSHMSAYVARQLDYPEPGEEGYELWLHIANFESILKNTK